MRTFFFLTMGAIVALIPASASGKIPVFNFIWLGFCELGLIICGILQSGFGREEIFKAGQWLNRKGF